MRIAALYDIHGNLPALEAVVGEIRSAAVDLVVVGGDVIAGPMPRETLSLLSNLEVPVRYLRGNAEAEVLAVRDGVETGKVPEAFQHVIRWVAGQLEPQDAEFVATWPATVRAKVPGLGDVLFCHATPRSDTEVFTRHTPEDRLVQILEDCGASLIVCGHTHMQFERTLGSTRVVNAGSVGMPYGRPGAYWLLLGPGIALQHTDYDLAAAAERVRATDYPMAEEFAATNILNPPFEEQALEVFLRAEIR